MILTIMRGTSPVGFDVTLVMLLVAAANDLLVAGEPR